MRTRPKNIKEFQKLVERYETITLEEIKKNPHPQSLTGLGTKSGCIVCKKVKFNCEICIYQDQNIDDRLGCMKKNNKKTFEKLQDIKTPKAILNAYRKRAEHLRKSYGEYLKNE